MKQAVTFVLLSFGCYRAWRFIGKDDITEFLRKPLPGFIVQGLSCPMCSGTWIAAIAAFCVDRYIETLSPHWGLWAGAVAGVVGLLGFIDEKLTT